MFWYDKHEPHTTYMDINDYFDLVLFDPPHLIPAAFDLNNFHLEQETAKDHH